MEGTALPNVLILGGCGFIGRNFASYLVENNLANYIRVIDKLPPSVAYFNEYHEKIFKNPIVKFKQANIQSSESLSRSCRIKNGNEYDYVFNFASETKYNQDKLIYQEKIIEVIKTIINELRKHKKVKRIFEISTTKVYATDKKSVNENSEIKPYTVLESYKREAENIWLESGLPIVILRAPIIYGPGDVSGLMPLITTARIYKFIGEKMRLLWTEELKMNTVHVKDVCRALWHLSKLSNPEKIYNISDKGNTDQKLLAKILGDLFGIKVGFFNSFYCNFAKLNLKFVTSIINEKHLKPWAALCSKLRIESSPLSPYISSELISDTSLSIDSSLLQSTGFTYEYPILTKESLQEVLYYWTSKGVFPPISSDESEEFSSNSGLSE